MTEPPNIQRWIGLDLHKTYFLAVGVDALKQTVFGPHKIPNEQLETWSVKHLQPSDAIVMEMTTNTYLFYDTLVPQVGSVIAVHPPNVRLVTGVKVKTDNKAALALAQLHAAGLLTGVWIPPVEVRELRSVIAQRTKMVRMATQAKNRLSSLLIRIRRESIASTAWCRTCRNSRRHGVAKLGNRWWRRTPATSGDRPLGSFLLRPLW